MELSSAKSDACEAVSVDSNCRFNLAERAMLGSGFIQLAKPSTGCGLTTNDVGFDSSDLGSLIDGW
jgi:hypothetical protein